MAGVIPDEQDPSLFQVDWSALKAGRNPWKRARKAVVDPFLVAKAVKEVMRQCPNRTATGQPLVWNDYAVFLDIADWTRIKKLEGTLVRGAAVWALSRLLPRQTFLALSHRYKDSDAAVREEWAAALG